MMNENIKGIICDLKEKGFGFIKVKGYDDKNPFFHAKDLRNVRFEHLRETDKVSISSIEKTTRGYWAKGIYLLPPGEGEDE